MNPQGDEFWAELRELTAASPQAAPELRDRLSREFARHHTRRRRRNRAAIVVGLAACVAISVALLRTGKPATALKVVEPSSQTAKAPLPETKPIAPGSPKVPAHSIARVAAKLGVPSQSTTEARNRHREPPPPVAPEAGDFIALPTFDPAIPLGESRMVRVDLPGSALQQIGYPVDGQLLDRRILTDVLVGQDGMPYAVRLVQARNIH